LNNAPKGFSTRAPSVALPANVVEALEQGHKIEAVKRMREQTGLGLKEAKDAVDAYDHTHAKAGEFSPGQVRGGRGSRLGWAAAAVIACAIYFILRRMA
jgi:hypothetical protein